MAYSSLRQNSVVSQSQSLFPIHHTACRLYPKANLSSRAVHRYLGTRLAYCMFDFLFCSSSSLFESSCVPGMCATEGLNAFYSLDCSASSSLPPYVITQWLLLDVYRPFSYKDLSRNPTAKKLQLCFNPLFPCARV